MPNYVSKVKVNDVIYDLKDILARTEAKGYVTSKDAVFENSIHMKGSTASGSLSTAIGNGTAAKGEYSVAEGQETIAEGDTSHSEGKKTQSSGLASHAEGISTIVEKDAEAGHAEGYSTKSIGKHSHAEGCETEAKGHATHVEGCSNIAEGSYSHVEGHSNAASGGIDDNGVTEYGVAIHIEGESNKSNASYSHIEGFGNEAAKEAQYVHISGIGNQALYADNKLIVGQYNENINEDIFEFGNGYQNEGTADTPGEIIRRNAIRINNKNKMYIYLDDIILVDLTTSENTGTGQPKSKNYSVADAVMIDDKLSVNSTRPVQNKVITEELNKVFLNLDKGKEKLVDALIEKGIQDVTTDMTFEELADSIRRIEIHSTVANDDLLFVSSNRYVDTNGQGVAMPQNKSNTCFITFYNFSKIE